MKLYRITMRQSGRRESFVDWYEAPDETDARRQHNEDRACYVGDSAATVTVEVVECDPEQQWSNLS